jgi:hypothetical protein
MHAVVRNYSGKGSKKLIDAIEKNKTEVEGLLRAINGFVSYYLAANYNDAGKKQA